MLYIDVVMPAAQLSFTQAVEAYCKDQLYGTNDCTMTLDALLAMMLCMMGATNATCGATATQLQCFLSLLSQTKC